MTRAMRKAAAGFTALVLALSGTACGDHGAPAVAAIKPATHAPKGGATAGPTPDPSSSPQPTLAELLSHSKAVHVRTADGVRLAGRLFVPATGAGTVGVVLSHQGGTAANQSDWWGLARTLADLGYWVLTYDFRGICPGGVKGCSGGTFGQDTQWKDLVAAVRFIREAGAARVALAGASIGAMASLVVAGMPDQHIAAVISLSGGEALSGVYELGRGQIQRVPCPKLFVAGKYDREFAAAARDWIRWASPPVEGHVLNTGLHGTDMLILASGVDARIPGLVRGLILGFLGRYVRVGS
jgi:dienelactone hydrolase